MADSLGILLCTYNGSVHLDEQLRSIGRQTHGDWRLAVSDDGSTDGTLEQLELFRRQHGERVVQISGPGKGFARNFLALVQSPPVSAAYWAFCDQDDIWEIDKLAAALDWLKTITPSVPALYCSRSTLIDVRGRAIGLSPRWQRPPAFRNALVQNIASGNTMVFNEAARQLLAQVAGPDTPFHDWLLYLAVCGVGGQVHFDPHPRIRYRQHGSNVLGPWGDLRSQWRRLRLLLDGSFGAWIDRNMADLLRIDARLNLDTRRISASFRARKTLAPWSRGQLPRELGIYHQSPLGDLALILALHLNRL